MANVCTDRNMKITAGVLGVEKWSVPRFVVDTTVNSTGDGSLTQQTTLPGKLMIDASASWVSDSPLDTMMLIRITRGARWCLTSNPNYVQFRDRWTFALDDTPRVPDVSNTFQAAFGGSCDRGTGGDSIGTPWAGKHWYYSDPTMTEDFQLVPSGSTFNMAYRCYVWTPPPWSNNANANTPVHSATANNVRIQLIAFPTQDTAAVIG